MQKQNTKTNKQVEEKATVKVVSYEQEICDKINKLAQKNNLIKLLKVTGYTALKYANKTVCELHFKRRSIGHLTVSNKTKVFELLNKNKLVTRVVADSFGWRLNTECLITDKLMQHFDAILQAILDEAIEEQNLKQQKQAKKEAKKATTTKTEAVA